MATPGIQLSGLASGLDTQSIISQLMAVERQPDVKLQTQQTIEKARKQALTDVQSRLTNLQTAVASLRDPSTWGDVQSTSSSDPTKVDLTRTAGAAAGAYQVTVSQLARANQFSQSNGATSVAADDVLHITIGTGGAAKTTDVNVKAGDSLSTVADRINATSGTPVYASVVNGQLVFSNKTTGTTGAISSVTTNGTSGLTFAESQTAQQAVFEVDGKSFTRDSNIVTDALAGLTLTLKAQIPTTAPVTITVGSPAPNTATIQSKVQAFVDQYNSTIDFIQGKLDEKKVPKATTSTDLAKGVLANDPGLESLLSSLRQSVSNVIGGRGTGAPTMLSDVGLSTGATTGTGALNQDSVAGKLKLDTTKLTDKLTSSFADVKALFTNVTGSYDTEGLAQRLDGYLGAWLDGSGDQASIMSSRLASEQSILDDIQQRRDDLARRLTDKQTQLQLQFTNLETALSKAQTEGQWLSGQLASLG
jgi:flagellar hook-associated protein 2